MTRRRKVVGRGGGLDRLLRPASVAVIGASARPGFPSRALANLVGHGYGGAVYPVNPNYDELAGLRCYPSLAAVGAPVDLALIAVPAAALDTVVADCAAAGVGAGVVFSSGFAELGAGGRAAQDRFTAIARDGGMRLLGPNCMGVITRTGGDGALVASFTASVGPGLGRPSGAAYVGQSGAIGGAVLGMARERGIGLSAWASTGNEADVTAVELGTALLDDDGVHVLALYLETVPDGAAWTALTTRARDLGKPVVVLRSGRSAPGRRAAASHTGAMVRGDAAFELACARDGVIGVDDVDELVDAVEMLLSGRRPAGPRVAVLTSSGGSGAIACDCLDAAGFTLAGLRPSTRQALTGLIPAYGSAANPVDVTAQLFNAGDDAFTAVCRPLLADDQVDALLIVLTTIIGDRADRLSEAVAAMAAEATKPIGVVWEAALGETWQARQNLRHAGVPVTTSIPRYVATLRSLLPATTPPGRTAVPGPAAGEPDVARAVEVSGGLPAIVTEARGGPVLDALGIGRPESVLVTDADGADGAVRAAGRLGGDLVVKISAPSLPHKTEIGGVRVGVTPAGIPAAYRTVRAAAPTAAGAGAGDAAGDVEGVLVQRRAPGGVELLVGVRGPRDGYPAVVTVGIGGVATEIYADTASALAPVTGAEAERLLRRLRGWPLLDGHRGGPPADVAAAATAVAALSAYAAALGGSLDELEINPLIVHPRPPTPAPPTDAASAAQSAAASGGAGGGVSAVDLIIRFTQR